MHIAEEDALIPLVREVPEKGRLLMHAFWPGPLTMIFQKKPVVPDETTGGLQTVAVRLPDNQTARDFIRAAGGYVAAPSANKSGRPSPTTAERVFEDMDGAIELILDGGQSVIGLESTIVDMTSETPLILRPGFISDEMLREVIGSVRYDATIFQRPSEELRPKAPGMKYRHYAPKGELKIVRGDAASVVDYIEKACGELKALGKRTAVIAAEENAALYHADRVINIGKRTDGESIARALYESLRDCDDNKTDVIFSEEFMVPGLGTAIMNRLVKAAGYEIIEV